MKLPKTGLCLFTILIVALIADGAVYAPSEANKSKIAAEEGLPKMLDAIKPFYQQFGFTSKASCNRAYLGAPIENYSLGLKPIENSKSLLEQAGKMPLYVYPVMSDGKIITDLTVGIDNMEWKAVDIGGHLCKFIADESACHNLFDSKIIRALGKTYVAAKDKATNKYEGYIVFNDNVNSSLKLGECVPLEKIKDEIINTIAKEKQIKRFKAQWNINQNINEEFAKVYND